MGRSWLNSCRHRSKAFLLGRARLQLRSDVPMQSFMPPIVLGDVPVAAFQINPPSHPPGRQPAQSQQILAHAQRGAVVTTDGSRQSMPFKHRSKQSPYRRGPRVGHPPQLQHHNGCFVPHRQLFRRRPSTSYHQPLNPLSHLIGRRVVVRSKPPCLRRTHSAPTGWVKTRPLQTR